MNKIAEQFEKYRHCSAHHLGLGDIRLSAGEQEEIAAMLPVWRDITTAPIETKIILMYGTLHGHIEDGYVYDDSPNGKRYYVLFDGNSLDSEPTHWMPLPKPTHGV